VSAHTQEVWMTPNHGQWDERVEYRVELQMGEMLIEKDGFSFVLSDIADKFKHKHGDEEEEKHQENDFVRNQLILAKFVGSNWKGEALHLDSSSFYRNYLLGNDPSKWFSGLHCYSQLEMREMYPGIDVLWDGTDVLTYSMFVKPGVNPDLIQMNYSGQDKLSLDKDGNLLVGTRFGNILQTKPIAWTVKDGRKTEVAVRFEILNESVGFYFPNGYDETADLVIDPSLVFSSFTGSTMDNWGMTATPDSDGNTFAAGIAFAGSGTYPTIPGSYDVSFNGGTTYAWGGGSLPGFDVAISKFNVDGSNLIYSTYLGGSANEAPHSMVADENDELYVFGVTSSSNFPVTPGAYDVSFNGGPNISSNELGYPQGSDIFVAHLNQAGTGLVGSTFVGGTGTDGINTGNLDYNYGDPFRGEIIAANGSVYVSSTSQSSDFPTVGASQGSLNGGQDAVIFKLNSALTSLNWSTYFGGSNLESGNALQLSSTGQLFVTGGTNSSNLPITGGNDLSFNGGVSDGYILKMSAASGSFVAGTYIGMAEYDQCYFVQLDVDNNVYVYGQTETPFPISPGTYGNANSGQFIRKYTNNLATILWTTMIGGGTGHPEISPTAFLVSDCYDIYISGWGGTINTSYSNQAFYSTSNGFPVTGDAFQASTNGSNFYIAVLGQDANSLKYGTYMGGTTNSWNHVDGGTSRFDKAGRIYHAVCAACGGNSNGFTSTPGVWSPINASSNCNLAAFKFELSTIEAIVSTPNNVVCLPDPVIFDNNSANGNAFYWSFGDGTYSSDINPSHVYPGPGTYTVLLVVSDTNGCYSTDSIFMDVYIGDFEGSVTAPTGPICPGQAYQLEASGGTVFQWSPSQYLDDPTSATPWATVDVTTDFMVIISDTCGIDTAYVTLVVLPISHTISDDISLCIGDGTSLFATGGSSYVWTPATFLDDPNSATPYCLPDVTTEYHVEITTADGCVVLDTVTVTVYYTPPVPIMPDLLTVCAGTTTEVTVSGAESYFWSPPINITPTIGATVSISPTSDLWYYCNFVNACGATIDSMFVDVIIAAITAGTDTIICPGQSVQLWASGGISYIWYPAATLSNVNTSLVTATPTSPTLYTVQGMDQYGCVDWDSVFVDLFPQAFIQANPDVYAFYGDEVQLTATSTTDGIYIWSPPEFLSCVACTSPIATPNQNYGYLVSYIDSNGCTSSDSVYIYYDPIIYVPNTFTPNGDGMNQFFLAVGGNIRTFQMQIFDRWGELIFTSNELLIGWDGKYDGKVCQDGTYIWKIKITDFQNEEIRYVGHVNLLR